jgi:hypothetical protein
MKTFKEFVTEELLPREQDDVRRRIGSGHSWYRQKFLEQHPKAVEAFKNSPDTKQWTHRVPVSFSEQSSVPHPDVIQFLKDKGYKTSTSSYKDGLVHTMTTVGDPERGIPMREKEVAHKIGGVLEKHGAPSQLKDAYTNDSFRTGAKTKDYDIVLTGHPDDIYGGSTGRGWDSCAQMRKGEPGYGGAASRSMTGEINNHTHMVYLVPRGGSVDTTAVGRMSFKHHVGLTTGHETLLPEDRVYGSTPDGFANKAKELVGNLFERKQGELYKKNDDVYNDNNKKFSFGEGVVPAEHLDMAWKSTPNKDKEQYRSLYGHIDPTQKYKSRGLNDVAKELANVQHHVTHGSFTDVVDAARRAGGNIDSKGQYYVLDSEHHSLRNVLKEGAKKFDMNNQDHIKALTGIGRYADDISRSLANSVSQNLGHATTVDHYMALSKLSDNGIYKDYNSKHRIAISDKHTMGRYPMDAIVGKLAETGSLNHETFSRAFLSTTGHTSRSGNVYDHAVHYENKGVPGMSKVTDDLAQNLDRNASFRGMSSSWDGEMAKSFNNMKPSTRTRIASSLGVNHVKIMRDGKSAIKEHDDLMRGLREKAEKRRGEETPL